MNPLEPSANDSSLLQANLVELLNVLGKLSIVEFEKRLVASLGLSLPYRSNASAAEAKILAEELKKDRSHAAVLILFGYSSGIGGKEPHMLITRRSQDMALHKGQMAFPGGVMEEKDQGNGASLKSSVVLTALRETHEEVGISRTKIRVLGVMPELPTFSSRFWVTPVVGLLNPFIDEIQLKESRGEIDEAYWVPMSRLLATDTYRQEWVEYENHRYRTHVFQIGRDRIWGATGIMIKNLMDRLTAVSSATSLQ